MYEKRKECKHGTYRSEAIQWRDNKFQSLAISAQDLALNCPIIQEVNQAINHLKTKSAGGADSYRLKHSGPLSENLFATLAEGTAFTKLDLSKAYQQKIFSTDYVTMNTHKGLYQ